MEERKSRYDLWMEEDGKPKEKRCTKCGRLLLVTEFYKHRYRSGAWGWKSWCKRCHCGAKKYKSQADRFWKFYHAHTQKDGDCLEWDGTCSNGVPSFHWDGKRTTVRRIVYRLACGDLPEDMLVITTCRNKRCVRQSHLKAATKDEWNMFTWNSAATGDKHGSRVHPERLRRGDDHPARLHPERLARGSRAGKSKLTEPDVIEIRRLGLSRALPQRAIAERFGVTQRAIWQIVHGKTWTHVR